MTNPVIVCAVDDRYAMPLAVMLRSLGDNLRGGVTALVWVLDGGVSRRSKRRVRQSIASCRITLTWVSVDESRLTDMPVFGHVSLATYYRLLMPAMLPDDLKKAIYLDVDMVVKGDIAELWAGESVMDYPLMAVEEQGWGNAEAASHRKSIGMNPASMYFNAGVLFVNLDEWRAKNIPLKVMQFLRDKEGLIKWHDQDGLNAVLEGQWGRLDPKWNCRIDPAESCCIEAVNLDAAKIVHFASGVKPWDFYAKNPNISLFYEYLNLTAWKKWRPRKPWRATLGNRYWYGTLMRKIPVVGYLWAKIRRTSQA